jgi:hypothetical protein
VVEFEIIGPFPIPTRTTPSGAKQILIKDFWASLTDKSISSQKGCYVFFVGAGPGSLPWYVGKTKNQKGFEGEIFSADKINKYHSVLMERRRSAPFFYFVKQTRHRGGSKKAIEELETYLIQTAFDRNEDLVNKQKLGKNDWIIKGCVGGGKGSATKVSVAFRQIMGLD